MMEAGDVINYQRTFTNEEVVLFGELTQNTARVHIETDPLGRLMVQGLLTASLPIKIGGDLNFLGQETDFRFVRPVYTGEAINCRFLIERIETIGKRTKAWCSWECTNQNNETVLTGSAIGVSIIGPDR